MDTLGLPKHWCTFEGHIKIQGIKLFSLCILTHFFVQSLAFTFTYQKEVNIASIFI